MRLSSGIVVIAVSACGPTVQVPMGGSSTTTTGPNASTTTPGSSSDGPATTSGPASTDGTSSGTTTYLPPASTGFVETSVCDPQPARENVVIQLIEPEDEDVVIAQQCQVLELGGGYAGIALRLDCGSLTGRPNVWIQFWPNFIPPNVDVGDRLDVNAARRSRPDIPGWDYLEHSDFVALREPGGDLVVGAFGSGPVPPEVDVAAWYSPLAFGPIDGLCDPDAWIEYPYPTDPLPCEVPRRRLALDFFVGGTTARIYDGNQEHIGSYDVRVEWAHRLLPEGDECGDADLTIIEWSAYR